MVNRRAISWVDAGAVAFAVVFLAFLVVSPGSEFFVTAVDDVVQLVVPMLAAALAARVAWRASGALRTSWVLIALASGAWAAGQAVWCWYELIERVEVPAPSLADLGYLAAIPLLLVGLARYPADSLVSMGRFRLALDALVVAFGLLFFSHGLFLGTVLEDNELTTLARVVAVAYPVADVVALAIVVPVLLRRGDGARGPLPLLVLGLVGLTIADFSFAYISAASSTALGDLPVNAGWVFGFGLVALAANHTERETAPTIRVAKAAGRAESAIPVVPVLLASAVLAGRVLLGEDISTFLGITGSGLLVCLGIRQIAIQLENKELTRSLHETVDQLRAREDELRHRAFHDPLTGLANRDLFRDRLDHALSRRRRPEPVAIAFIDLDDFKRVNDTLGHDAGDQLLVLVAERLRASTRVGDTVARLGGDEFAVLVEDGRGDALGERLLEAFEVPFSLNKRELEVNASVGVATGMSGIQDSTHLLQDADLAMYAAKAAGKGQSAFFEPAMREGAVGLPQSD